MKIKTDGWYHSFADYMSANNIEPKSKVNKDETKTAESKDKFVSHHKCKACKEPMTFVASTNMMVCKNPLCKGIKQIKKDKEGNEIISYLPSYDILEDKYAKIATTLFAE